jgi:F-type H+-transporting ATPase subunit gamma
MANLRAIRTRIKSVENTRQITKSMKMVAAAKLRKTQAAFLSLRAYAERSGDILRQIGGELTAQGSPDGANGVPKTPADASVCQDEESVPQGADRWILPRGETRTVCYVLVVGNRGLCGTYNQALLRYCENIINSSDKQSYVICCGRWGKDLIASAGIPVRETVEISDTPTREEALELAERLKSLYSEGTADEIVFVYQHYRTVLSQEPTSMTLLPIAAQAQQSPSESPSCGDVIFEPDRESVLSTLLDMYIGNTVHAVLLEARCGEHSARMTAMTAAADNTEELIGKLTLELNHARQAAITTELSEIAGGAEALRSSKAE